MRSIQTLTTLALAAAALVAAVAVGPTSFAQDGADKGKTYKLGTEVKHTNVTFVSEADVENIYGSTTKVNGTTWLDFENGKGKCDISIPVANMTTQIDLRDEHMRSEKWLDAAKYPDITFKSAAIKLTEGKKAGRYDAKATGTLSIHGVSKEITADVDVRAIPMSVSGKFLGEGEWVRVTTSFDVTLSDFGIKIPEGQVAAKVSETWQIKFDCYGVAGGK